MALLFLTAHELGLGWSWQHICTSSAGCEAASREGLTRVLRQHPWGAQLLSSSALPPVLQHPGGEREMGAGGKALGEDSF